MYENKSKIKIKAEKKAQKHTHFFYCRNWILFDGTKTINIHIFCIDYSNLVINFCLWCNVVGCYF